MTNEPPRHGPESPATAALFVLRARFVWWPLHPFGMVMWSTCRMNLLWFSMFVGWAAKVTVSTFPGTLAYRRWLPFFLGMVRGESLMGAFRILVGLITGTPGIFVMPT